jgi:D-serine deaminase-like pyridoxal phosphate-dependent protein
MRGVAGHNAGLIGVPGGRSRLETPALIVDAAQLEANIGRLAAVSHGAGIGMRPHAKSHKCAAIARLQMEAGALGIACAKTGELLALLEAGIDRLMLTAPISHPAKIARLTEAARQAEIIVVVDRLELVSAFGDAARTAGSTLAVLVDCDTGLGRTGVTTPEDAVTLARAIAAEPGLLYAGVQAYAGRVQHVFDHEERRTANRAANDRLVPMLAALAAERLTPEIISGGGTGSHLLDGEEKVLTEVQAGSYVFMDEGYFPADLHGTGETVFPASLFVAVGVIAHSAAGEAITDAGSKSLAVDGPLPHAFARGVEIGRMEWAGDEFGRIKTAPGIATPPIGAVLECTVPHCDPTVNLHDYLHVVRGDVLEAIWPIEGRGLSD